MRPATLEQAERAKEKLDVLLGDAHDVRGLGIAVLDGGFGIKLNLQRAPKSGSIPDDVDGVPVIIDVVGAIRA
jgi:hypothetical protein